MMTTTMTTMMMNDDNKESSVGLCDVVNTTHRTNLTCSGIYTQQMYKISSNRFRHSIGASIRQSSQWSK